MASDHRHVASPDAAGLRAPGFPPEIDRIGPYRILEELGHGGMGVVYLAEQTEPVRRRVALKLVKLGMDTREVVARFEAERQVLAVLDHPNIAKVFDAGATDLGRPYFVMELVRGVPITEYCDTHKLTVRERLELFVPVCRAVQHAHQKGIIHRDLKPSNVLVTVQDSGPVPKVIDFGIAKAVGQSLTGRTLHTGLGLMLGTPEYMSPEQAEASGLDVDTRTDIYSLGVMLYELLAGALPFEAGSLGRAEFVARYVLRESEAPTLSMRFQSLGNGQTTVAAHRRTSPKVLRQELRGDPNAIVMKAMEKDRTRRYETANGLALDLQRYLNDEPVLARAPSTSYWLRKFTRRHRAAVAAATVAVVALVGGLALATAGLVRARRAERTAAAEAAVARQVSDFLVGLFTVSDPRHARGSSITAREILDRGSERIRTELSGQPPTQARLMHTMGQVYHSLGLYDPAIRLLEEALALRQRASGDYSLEAAETRHALAFAYMDRGRLTAAESLFVRALGVRERALGANHPEVAATLSALGIAYLRLGRYDDAERLFRRALAVRERLLGPAHTDVAQTLTHLGMVHQQRRQHTEAAGYLERALAIRQKMLPPDHPDLAASHNNLGTAYYHLRRYDAAAPLYTRAMEIWRRTLGPAHQNVAGGLVNLGLLEHKRGRFTEAESLLTAALGVAARVLDPAHPLVAVAAQGLGDVYRDAGRSRESARAYERVLAIRQKLIGEQHPDLLETLVPYAAVLRRIGRAEEAAAIEARARVIRLAAAQRK